MGLRCWRGQRGFDVDWPKRGGGMGEIGKGRVRYDSLRLEVWIYKVR
jgi:hypothetical protein